MHDDGVFNDCQFSDQEFDDEIVSIDSQTDGMYHNEFNDIIDSQLIHQFVLHKPEDSTKRQQILVVI
jgi:hypothetical protein